MPAHISKKVLVVGSVAFDKIFPLRGTIRDKISFTDMELGAQNMMFFSGDRQEHFGGTGGNIAYGLGLLKIKPILFSVAGKDFKNEYAKHLADHGVDTRIFIDNAGFTATAYMMTDEAQEQIGVWEPNSYGKFIDKKTLASLLSSRELAAIEIAIFSAGTEKSILSHMREFRKHNTTATIIFDPGQITSIHYDKKLLSESCALATILIVNDTELQNIKTALSSSTNELLSKGLTIIETKGVAGSIIYIKDGVQKIAPVLVKKVVDPTGAGDAYRTGLIAGLIAQKSLADACHLGAQTAAKCIRHKGGQEYKF
ncbi:MAG: PfkB family carbohydrate kinase [bacterium]